ncbi:hypothetical protein MLD38_019494 [Melastoma candidum]|uniref:Uncharacterized protein n=1 Tax=Melastoma candidum TaxID=119954 RepID=A0ACB9QWL8_9MYRT|nr:hypothetical protein MLD38_019494 [Melastoma candidum]
MSLEIPSPVLVITFLISSLIIFRKLWSSSKAKHALKSDVNAAELPPGPKRLPLIGNLHQMAGALPHHSLANLAKKHGPIMHLQLGEMTTVVISSPEVAREILKEPRAFLRSEARDHCPRGHVL